MKERTRLEISPSYAAAWNRELSMTIDAAAKSGNLPEMQRLLSEMTALMHYQFGYPKTN